MKVEPLRKGRHVVRARYWKAVIFPAVAVAFCLSDSSARAASLEQDFLDLSERCRISIEENQPFDSIGLRPAPVAERHQRKQGVETLHRGWRSPGSELYVVETEWTSRDGPSRRLCHLHLKEEDRVLAPAEQAALLQAFLAWKAQLVGAGRHEGEPMATIQQYQGATFLLSDRNPKGCRVISSLFLKTDGTVFSEGSGEQAIAECDEG